jgi:hypothetical protein
MTVTTTETPYGTVTIHPDSVAVSATGSQLQSWARRPGAIWPCAVLPRFTNLCAWFDRDGLIELQGYDCDNEPDVYDTDDVPGDELTAWSSDVLRGVLPADHPAHYVAVAQFEEVR